MDKVHVRRRRRWWSQTERDKSLSRPQIWRAPFGSQAVKTRNKIIRIEWNGLSADNRQKRDIANNNNNNKVIVNEI